MRRTGSTRLGARGDFPGYSTPRRRLRAGDWWRPGHTARGIGCRLSSSSLWCANVSGHGFRISKSTLERF
jgi:hypothetical protein